MSHAANALHLEASPLEHLAPDYAQKLTYGPLAYFVGGAVALLGAAWMAWEARALPTKARIPRWAVGAIFLGASCVCLFKATGLRSEAAWMKGVADAGVPSLGKVVPELSYLSYPDGKTRRLSELRGKPIVLNLWASWCGPCRRELPAFVRFQEAHAGEGLTVLALSDEAEERMKRYLTLQPIALPVGRIQEGDGLSLPFALMEKSRPVTLFIDAEGRLRDFLLGEQTYEHLTERWSRR